MPDQAVVNASPLIFLARAGRLEFLQLAAPEILVPAAVALEIRQYDADMVEVPAVPPPIQAWDLGPGESSVLAYAMAHRPMIAIIDDLSARHCAEVFRIPVSGTLGLVIPDESKTLRQGAIKPWQTQSNAECQDDLMRFAKKRGVPADVPWHELSEKHKH